ncbi:amino acid permease C-terminal domain-containing protein, partial [Lactiplantibacillus plantarum]|uniref:amino acid permease C-terminal domain-containing protein n=1 Tax=Lactiplantibacillus plantarum TaxID=1590 RepID=UPI0024B20FCC
LRVSSTPRTVSFYRYLVQNQLAPRVQPDLRRPFKTPWVPFVPIMSIICCIFLLINLKPVTWTRFVVWLAIGMVVYFGYSVKHSQLKTNTATDEK